MKIKYLGHAAFLTTSEEGTKIITDPYSVGGGVNYGKIQETADIVVVSHAHGDHHNVAAVRGNPQVVEGAGSTTIKGIEFKGIASYHDEAQGRQRGENTIFCFAVDEVRICHLGDLGHQLEDYKIAEIGEVDILLIPVGGLYTVDAKGASQICDKLKPKVVIPMHYKTAKCVFPIAGVEDFLKGKEKVRRLDTSEVEFKKEQLPTATEVVVLKHAL